MAPSYMRTFFYAGLAVVVCRGVLADTPAPPPQEPRSYCGVKALYVALRSQGVDVPFSHLLKPKYIGSWNGSTVAELVVAAKDQGIEATAVGSLTTAALRSIDCPVILHVKGTLDSPTYDHWILYLGHTDGKPCIFDPANPRNIGSMEYRQLRSQWDGTGILVSPNRWTKVRLYSAMATQYFLWSAVALLIAAVVVSLERRFIFRTSMIARRLAVETVAIGVIAIAICGAWRVVAGGLLSDAIAFEALQERVDPRPIDEIGLRQVEQFIAKGAIVVDARNQLSYARGHVEGAINIPPTIDVYRGLAEFAETPKDAHVVVYCESSNCPYSDRVARALVVRGYKNVRIYRAGWVEWKARHSEDYRSSKHSSDLTARP